MSQTGRFHIEAGDPALEAGLCRRIVREHQRVMTGNNVVWCRGKFLQSFVALEDLGDVLSDRKDPPLLEVGVKVCGIGGEHHVAAIGFDPHRLQSF